MTTPNRISRFASIILALSITACGGSDGAVTTAAAPTSVATDPSIAMCADLYKVGGVLPEGAEDGACISDDGAQTFLGSNSMDCPDGDAIAWNDAGTWQVSDRLLVEPLPDGFTTDDVLAICDALP